MFLNLNSAFCYLRNYLANSPLEGSDMFDNVKFIDHKHEFKCITLQEFKSDGTKICYWGFEWKLLKIIKDEMCSIITTVYDSSLNVFRVYYQVHCEDNITTKELDDLFNKYSNDD